MRIVAVVVTYNRLAKIKLCIKALQTYAAEADILIVDNASTDGTAEWLASPECDKRVRTLLLKTNIGGAGGFCEGVRWGVENGYDRLWLMDDDCYVNSETLSGLLNADHLLGGDYGWLSSVALWTDGAPCLMNKQKTPKDFYPYAHLLGSTMLQATQATFVSLFLPADTVKRFGLPIKEFFIWGDDVEFTRRVAVRGGQRSFVVGASTVTHDMASNNGSNIATDNESRIKRYSYAYRNEAYLYRKEGWKGVSYFVAKCAYNIARILTQAKSKRLMRMWTLTKNSLRGLFFSPTVEFPTQNEKQLI